MQWCFELVARGATAASKINFGDSRESIRLHLFYRRQSNQLVINHRGPSGWHREMLFPLPDPGPAPATLYLSINEDAGGGVVVRWRGGAARPPWLRFQELRRGTVWAEEEVIWHRSPDGEATFLRDWRLLLAPSGFPAGNATLARQIAGNALQPGASFLIRARNEAHNAAACLRSIAGLADEVIFVDNNSTDGTAAAAAAQKQHMFELKTFSYPHDIPRAGADHAQEVFAGGSNTLGHYYNWCLARAGRANIIKWDADYIALRDNLADMIRHFDLRTRGDHFVLWFSGLELYTDGTRHWVDPHSVHSEFRAFSLAHGHHWVNLPPWEELDQSHLFSAHKLFWPRPVYVELFRLDEIEFRDRGLFADDTRDRERLEYIRRFRQHGQLPAHFIPVDGAHDPRLSAMPVSTREWDLALYFDAHFRAAPKLRHPASGTEIDMDMVGQDDVAVFILSCARNTARRQAIRETWAADLKLLGIPYYFIIGRPGQEPHVVGDTLFLDVPDSYEFLASKVLAAMEFSLARMNVSHVFKIDDDCVLDAWRFLRCDYRDADFTGGGIAGGPGSIIDWHAGKCANPQLDDLVYFRERDTFWVGGQYGYFLSQAARRALVAEQAMLRGSLYEDYIVAKALAAHSITPRVPFGRMVALKHQDPDWHARTDVMLVADVPDDIEMRATYRALIGPDRAARERARAAAHTTVDFDHADFAAMRRTLAPPDGMAAPDGMASAAE